MNGLRRLTLVEFIALAAFGTLAAVVVGAAASRRADAALAPPPASQTGASSAEAPAAEPARDGQAAKAEPALPGVLAGSFASLRAAQFQSSKDAHDRLVQAFSAQVKNWYFWDHYILAVVHLQYDAEGEARESFKKAVQLEPRLKPGVDGLLREYQAFGDVRRPYGPLIDVLGK